MTRSSVETRIWITRRHLLISCHVRDKKPIPVHLFTLNVSALRRKSRLYNRENTEFTLNALSAKSHVLMHVPTKKNAGQYIMQS